MNTTTLQNATSHQPPELRAGGDQSDPELAPVDPFDRPTWDSAVERGVTEIDLTESVVEEASLLEEESQQLGEPIEGSGTEDAP